MVQQIPAVDGKQHTKESYMAAATLYRQNILKLSDFVCRICVFFCEINWRD
jgi:hypothetical protein